MSKKKFSGNISGKGYYIALILCAAAIGITGYLYYRNGAEPEDTLQTPDVTMGDVQAVATQPEGTVPQDPTVNAKKPPVIKKPLAGQTLAEYSMDALCYNQTTRDWRVHDGVDIAAEAGTQVVAAAAGTVYSVYEDETMGMTVVIRHDGGYTTRYASLGEQLQVKAGQTVTAGQAIGVVGNTALLESGIGEHLHFSVSCAGVTVDPEAFLEGA